MVFQYVGIHEHEMPHPRARQLERDETADRTAAEDYGALGAHHVRFENPFIPRKYIQIQAIRFRFVLLSFIIELGCIARTVSAQPAARIAMLARSV